MYTVAKAVKMHVIMHAIKILYFVFIFFTVYSVISTESIYVRLMLSSGTG